MTGIVGYGVYIPFYRIKTAEIARVWGEGSAHIEKGLGIIEKAVGGVDEDAATLSVQAARDAVVRAGISAKRIGAVYVGSESHPYAVKPTATIVAEALGATPETTAADLEFACKAGTAGIQMLMGMVAAKIIEYGLTIGADTAQGRPGDALEYSAGSGAAAFIIGAKNESLATLDATFSYTTDTPDFWRRQGSDYPSHGGRFTGGPAYFKHVRGAAEGLLKKTGMKAIDFDHVVFHQPNAKFPLEIGKQLGIPIEKMKTGLLIPTIGNTYSGASMIGLAAVLDEAKSGERIMVVSYGSGAGSDAFCLTVTDKIEEKRNLAPFVKDYVARKQYIDYSTYIKFRRKIKN